MTELSWSIGDVRITRIEESVTAMPPTDLLPEATADAMGRHASWLVPHFVDADGGMLLSIHGLVIESEGRRILVDTCVGEREMPGFEMLSGASSPFLENLEAAGFPRDSIDTVLCTHLHFDHVGWNTTKEGDRWVPTFPQARYLFARVEWEHWRDEDSPIYTPTLGEAVRPIIDAGLADLVETDHRLTGEVGLEATPGHTPGHVAVQISSRGERAMITGDLTHHPVQWAEPDWKMPADVDGAQASATRRRLLEEHGGSPLLVIGTHYAPPTSGRLTRDGSGWIFRATTD